MGRSLAARNTLADTEASLGSWISLHTDDPGATGANEAAVARVQTSWGAATSGTVTGSKVSFNDVPPGTYKQWAIWTAETGGTFVDAPSVIVSVVTLTETGPIEVTPRITVQS